MTESNMDADDNTSVISDLTAAPSGIFSEPSSNAFPSNSNTIQPNEPTISTLQQPTIKNRTSFVWQQDNGEEYRDTQGKLRWRCRRCPTRANAQTYADTGTTHPAKHLAKAHSIYLPQRKDLSQLGSNSTPINPGSTTGSTQLTISQSIAAIRPRLHPFEFNHKLLLDTILNNNLSFSIVNNVSFRRFLGYLAACVSFLSLY